jgi:AraC family transcriptional regulator
MFKAATGLTPHSYLQKLRLETARQRLSSPRGLITQIALDCGFSSHSHFTQVFRARFGLTPQQYRRQARSPARMILR